MWGAGVFCLLPWGDSWYPVPRAGGTQTLPFPDEFGHLLLHLFAFQLFLEKQFKPRHRAIALGILLIRLGSKQK